MREIKGANLDIDLVSKKEDISWEQENCPWNKSENSDKHKCAVKNISICKYFQGIKKPDVVLCSFPEE